MEDGVRERGMKGGSDGVMREESEKRKKGWRE
jgi:hypothetical protein